MSRYAKTIENLKHAIALIEAVPADAIDMSIYQINTGRGPIRDLLGWIAQSEYFRAQGMRLLPHGHGYAIFNVAKPDALVTDVDWLDDLFGLHAYARLFEAYGGGDNDRELVNGGPMPSEKDLGLKRLKRQLVEYERANVFGPVLRFKKEKVHAA